MPSALNWESCEHEGCASSMGYRPARGSTNGKPYPSDTQCRVVMAGEQRVVHPQEELKDE
jgi:hypothetical protein